MRLAFAAAALALTACASAPQPPPSAPLTIALTPLRERLRTIDVAINGVHGQFVFDSARGVGCTPKGRLVGYRMTGDRIDAQRCDGLALDNGGARWTSRSVGVFDVSPFLAPGQTAPDGNLALDVFENRVVTLDVAHNALIVETEASLPARIAGAMQLPARLSREAQGASLSVNVGVPTPDGLAWFELDSGNGGSVLVSKHLAAAFHLDPAAQGPQQLEMDVAPAVHLSTARAFTPDLIIDGNLGMPFLSHYIVTLDLAHERVWVKPSAP